MRTVKAKTLGIYKGKYLLIYIDTNEKLEFKNGGYNNYSCQFDEIIFDDPLTFIIDKSECYNNNTSGYAYLINNNGEEAFSWVSYSTLGKICDYKNKLFTNYCIS